MTYIQLTAPISSGSQRRRSDRRKRAGDRHYQRRILFGYQYESESEYRGAPFLSEPTGKVLQSLLWNERSPIPERRFGRQDSSVTLGVGQTTSIEITHTSKNAVSLISRTSRSQYRDLQLGQVDFSGNHVPDGDRTAAGNDDEYASVLTKESHPTLRL